MEIGKTIKNDPLPNIGGTNKIIFDTIIPFCIAVESVYFDPGNMPINELYKD